jgi:hypothetical protein
MENPTKHPQKVLIMSESEWKKNKAWLKQFPGVFCIPVIDQLERYLRPLPAVPSVSPDPSSLIPEENKIGIEPDGSSKNQDQK